VDLVEAIGRAKADLSSRSCHTAFDDYFQRLVEVAAGYPDLENKKRFSNFLLWARSEGILNMIQAKEYYNRYFNDTFMSLPDEYNVCASCFRKNEIGLAMEQELRQKDRGLLKACGDKKSYYRANEHYNNLLVVLDATCLACENGKP